MKKIDFNSFEVGTIFNILKGYNDKNRSPVYKEVTLKFPSRLNAMAIDPSKIATNNNLVYTAGEVVFIVDLYLNIRVKVIKSGIEISEKSSRKSLIRHAFLIMKKTLGFKNGFYIEVNNEDEIKHAGLGSSGRLIAGVASAINEIFLNPIPKNDLIRFLAQNHGEETEDPNKISPVQCMGGSASAGLTRGGMKIILGDSRVVKTMNLSNEYDVVIGIPKDYSQMSGEKVLNLEVKNIKGFIDCGKKYGKEIAYRMLHEVIPAMDKQDLVTIGDLIYDYRFEMESIKNCSFTYPELVNLSEKLKIIKGNNLAPILSLSSVGPGFFVITKNSKKCESIFKKCNLQTIICKIENEGYKIVSRR